MGEKYFDIQRDITICNAGGFFCEACLIGKERNEASPDPRYCVSCFKFLQREAQELKEHRKKLPEWVPQSKIIGAIIPPLPIHIGKRKTKLSTLNSLSPTVDNFRPRGRPKTYKKRLLPEEQIRQLHKDGMGAKAIATKLKNEQGIVVSYKTIQRLLD